MTRQIRLIFLVAWLVGALAAGYTVEPGPAASIDGERVVVRTAWVELTAERDRLVLAVGQGEAAWRVATPVPSFAKPWLRSPETTPPPARTSVAERAIVILFQSNYSSRP